MSTGVRELLGGEEVLGGFVESNLDLAMATRAGLPSAAAIQLAREILDPRTGSEGAGYVGRLAGDAAAIALAHTASSALIANQSLGGFGLLIGSLVVANAVRRRLTPVESDLVVRTATALAKAIDVLGEKSKAVHWIKNPNQALGGLTPLSLLDTSAGQHEVEALLDRIEYGVYS